MTAPPSSATVSSTGRSGLYPAKPPLPAMKSRNIRVIRMSSGISTPYRSKNLGGTRGGRLLRQRLALASLARRVCAASNSADLDLVGLPPGRHRLDGHFALTLTERARVVGIALGVYLHRHTENPAAGSWCRVVMGSGVSATGPRPLGSSEAAIRFWAASRRLVAKLGPRGLACGAT